MNEAKNNSIKQKDKTQVVVLVCVVVVILAAVFFAALLPGLRKNRTDEEAGTPVLENDTQKYEYYVGPEDSEDRGEWVDPRTYYGLFEASVKEADPVSALFGDGEHKGIVPAGIRIEPVLFSYDDYEPFDSPMTNGFLDAYKVSRYCDANGDLTEPVELQLGVQKNALRIYNSYSVAVDDGYDTANARLTFEKMNYYLENRFDPTADGETIDVPAGTYGFLEPVLSFDYDGIVKIGKYDPEQNRIGTIEIEMDGTMEDGMWEYTANLAGQLSTNFKTGELYIRCKLPCTVTETVHATGETKTAGSNVNVYFKVSEVRLGTWADCMPKNR